MSALRRYYDSHLLGCDLVVAVLLSALVIGAVECLWGRPQVIQMFDGARQGIYGALASVAASLLGFSITTVSLVMVLMPAPRLQLVRDSRHHHTLYDVFFSTIKYLALAVVVPLVALFLDRDQAPSIRVCYAVLVITAIATVRFSRSMWALEHVVRLAIAHRR